MTCDFAFHRWIRWICWIGIGLDWNWILARLVLFLSSTFFMELLPVAQSKDQGREQQHDDDASTTNLLAPPRPQSQRFHSHDHQSLPSTHSQPPRLWQISWWLLTIVLSAFILATVKIYRSQGNFNPAQKHIFNTITTGLILALGLNFFVSHQACALGDMHSDSSMSGLAGSIQILS